MLQPVIPSRPQVGGVVVSGQRPPDATQFAKLSQEILVCVTAVEGRPQRWLCGALRRLESLRRLAASALAAGALLCAQPSWAASAFDVGTFTKSTGAAPVVQSVSHTLGVVPSAIILWTTGNTNVTGFQAGFEAAVGVSDTSTSRSFGAASQDAAGTSNTARRVANVMLTIIGPTSGNAPLAEATLNAVSATTFDLRWGTNDANAYVIHYLVVGGTDIQARVGAFTMATATGNQSITGVGFQPDLYLLVHAGSGLTGAAPATQVNAGFGFGYADASGDQWAFSLLGIDAAGTSDTYRSQRVAESLTSDTSVGGGTFSKLASWVSMDTDGFTLNYTTANASAGQVAYLALKGVNVFAGSFNKISGTGNQAVAGLGFQPKAVFLAGFQDVTNAAPIVHARMGLGMSDGTSEASLAFTDADNLGTTNVNSISKSDKVFMKVNNEPPTVQAEADLVSLDSGGFTLNWSTGDTEATEIVYLALGSLPPTLANLDSFDAIAGPDGVQIGWNTSYELDHLGFRLFSERGTRRVALGPDLFPGAVLRAGAGTPLTAGASYDWTDARGSAGDRYWLQGTHLDGSTQWYGPVTARAGNVTSKPRRTAKLTGSGEANSESSRVVWTGPLRTAAGAEKLSLAGRPTLKIGVAESGWYRVTGTQVRAALGSSVDPRRLVLQRDGLQVALQPTGAENGRLDDEDTFAFFGVALDGTHTDTRWYWLSQAGAERALAPHPGGPSTGPSTDLLDETVELQGRSIYFPVLRDASAPPFFAAAVTSVGTQKTLQLSTRAATAQSATLQLDLQGVSAGNHSVEVTVGGAPQATLQWAGAAPHQQTLTLAPGTWSGGALQLGLRALAGASDISLLKSAKIHYPRTLGPDDVVVGELSGPATLTVADADSSVLRALDITDPDRPLVLSVSGSGGNAEIQLASAGRRVLYVHRDSDAKAATTLERLEQGPTPPNVAGANWIVVGPRALLAAVEPLEAVRRNQGLHTARVAAEDIYNAYTFGAKDPEALRLFFRNAWESQPLLPRQILLVGDASFDPRGFLQTTRGDLLPVAYASTGYLRTAVEDSWVDFNSDGLPEWPVGRLPGRDTTDVEAMVQKLISPWAESSKTQVNWAVGRPRDFDFESLILKSDGGGVTRKVMVWNSPTAGMSPDDVFSTWAEEKPKIAGYLGHGSVATWSDGLLNSDQVSERARFVRAPLLLALSCLNGAFDDAYSDSVAESWLRLPDAGAQSVIAFSGLMPPHEQVTASDAIVEATLRQGKTLGEALLEAKASVHSADVRKTLLLLGDPAHRLAFPPKPSPTRPSGCGGGSAMAVLAPWFALAFLFRRVRGRSS
ncbi:MAG: C25 family cysteine peptidase [Myxococcaceae bacterium]